jgi:hypothetical protein
MQVKRFGQNREFYLFFVRRGVVFVAEMTRAKAVVLLELLVVTAGVRFELRILSGVVQFSHIGIYSVDRWRREEAATKGVPSS